MPGISFAVSIHRFHPDAVLGFLAFGDTFLGGIPAERFRVVLLLWEVLTPVFPVCQLFGKSKDRVNVMPSARSCGGTRYARCPKCEQSGLSPRGRGNP